MDKDCYFWIDNTLPEDERMLNILCKECHKQHYAEDFGWFWEGSVKGYGPFDYKCGKCEKIIHAASKITETNESSRN
jgi:hypothetical protein